MINAKPLPFDLSAVTRNELTVNFDGGTNRPERRRQVFQCRAYGARVTILNRNRTDGRRVGATATCPNVV